MNNLQDTINMQEIVELGKLLHENGDKVLNALSKLSLSTSLLHNLNEAFSLIVDEPADLDASFHVCNSSKIDIFRDLKFLHDFVQKTVGLKVTYNQNNLGTPVVDITKFRHLKYLELKKVNIDCVKGLQGVRGQLESIICVGRKGVHNVSQLLASCGSDAGIGFVWGSLKHLTLSHNGLERLDTSLELAPWLQILDLSYNLISSADELCCLPNLKYINLGYNKLEVIPIINKTATYTLRVLVLKNNYIENLNGIQNLECLTELDVSYNCLMEHSTLWPLGKMCTLLWISLEGNPLSYHPKHRLLSMKYLHPSLSNSKFVLDHLPLSRSEQKIVADNRPFTIRSEHSVSNEILGSMSDSINSSTLSTFTNSLTIGQNIAGQSTKGTGRMEIDLFKSKRRSTIKEAIIVEAEYEKKELVVESDICSSYLETSKDHLETKKQILAVRERYGEDDWLSNHAGTFVQDIMGLHSLSYPELTLESAVKDLDTNTIPILNPPDSAMFLVSHVKLEKNENCESLIKENSTVNCEIEDVNAVLNEKENVLNESVDSDTHAAVINVPDHMYDPEEETGDLYLVQRKKYNNEIEDLFLIITSDNIKERDAITGKLKCSWSTSSVLSCVLGRSEPITVDIIFDTTREERQNRRYLVEPDIAKKIVQIIGQRMQKRMISLKVFKCMKCSTHFSQDSEYILIMSSTSATQQLKCPTCRSTLVIETDELSTLDVESDTSEPCSEWLTKNQCLENKVKANLQHSDSSSSIGSAMSLEESRESTPSTNVLNKKYESDIEILSNPSQSSIEVLDDASRNLTPHRKRSSEERRTAVAPSLLTIPDAAPIATGLTESSSSGSLTDSICTAYENKIVKQTTADDKSLSTSDKETRFTPVTNLTSMLGGLLQSITIGSNKSLMLKSEESPNFFSTNIQYSYTDFSSIDHRIKLHIILNICEHENEELILLLRAEILLQNTKDTFPGCLVLSTSKVYVLKITGPEGEDPQRWLHKEVSWTIDRLRRFSPIPFKQGIVIEIDQPNKMNDEFDHTITFLCILQDFQRTVNFLFYITDFLLQPLCEEVEFVVPEHCTMLMHQLVKNCKDYQDGDAVRQLALFSSAILKYQDLEVVLKTSSLIVTASVLVICNIQWFLPGNNETPQIIREQSMSNLIGVDNYNSTLTLNFLDEIAGQEETWTLDFVSVGAAEIVIASVRSPWEELFSIPLQNTVCKLQANTDT